LKLYCLAINRSVHGYILYNIYIVYVCTYIYNNGMYGSTSAE